MSILWSSIFYFREKKIHVYNKPQSIYQLIIFFSYFSFSWNSKGQWIGKYTHKSVCSLPQKKNVGNNDVDCTAGCFY